MKIGISMNSDGRFTAVTIHNRKKMLSLLKEIDCGDYYANIRPDWEENDNDDDILEISDDRWESFLWVFVQRGTFEIIDVSLV